MNPKLGRMIVVHSNKLSIHWTARISLASFPGPRPASHTASGGKLGERAWERGSTSSEYLTTLVHTLYAMLCTSKLTVTTQIISCPPFSKTEVIWLGRNYRQISHTFLNQDVLQNQSLLDTFPLTCNVCLINYGLGWLIDGDFAIPCKRSSQIIDSRSHRHELSHTWPQAVHTTWRFM